MSKSVKLSESNKKNRYSRLVDNHFQSLLTSLKGRNDENGLFYVNGIMGARRKTAVLNSVKKLENDLRAIDSNFAPKAFVEHEFIPFFNYDDIDDEYDLRIGASLWILNNLLKSGNISEAYKLLPYSNLDFDDWYLPPGFSHPCFSDTLINSVIHVITNRYSQTGANGIIISPESVKGVSPVTKYIKLIRLLPVQAIEKASNSFREKIYELSLRVVRGVVYFDKEIDLVNEEIRNTLDSALSTFASSSSGVKNLSKADIFTQSLFGKELHGMSNDYFSNLSARRLQSLALQFDKLKQGKGSFYVDFDHYLMLNKKDVLKETSIQEIADCTDGFSVQDPYEMCFALFHLTDLGDDAPWLMNSGFSLMYYVQQMLPWYVDKSQWNSDDFDSWYEYNNTYNRNKWLEQKHTEEVNYFQLKHKGKNITQVFYDLCHTVLPNGMHPFEMDRKKLIEEGMDEALANRLTDLAEMNFFLNFQYQQNPLSDFDEEDLMDFDDSEMEENSVRAVIKKFQQLQNDENIVKNRPKQIEPTSLDSQKLQSLQNIENFKDEISVLKQQIKSLKNTLAVSRQEQLREKTRYEHELKNLRLEHRELADLREIVFNQNEDKDVIARRESLEKAYSYPYVTRKKIVIFGGHDSWLKVIKPMLPDVRFVEATQYQFDPNLIKNADVVWIQSNCMGHAQFSNIINKTRQYGVQLRYFGYASAEKCAEQLVTEDLKS